jgi:hypothetical protein
MNNVTTSRIPAAEWTSWLRSPSGMKYPTQSKPTATSRLTPVTTNLG